MFRKSMYRSAENSHHSFRVSSMVADREIGDRLKRFQIGSPQAELSLSSVPYFFFIASAKARRLKVQKQW